ncbi:thioredoxin family protein [Pseudobacteriovorax antillogorgiicola]|uniref:Thioredoxin n=1 Tax=Pseudobacteriovorax antillogorgiicola TaxID=1513793 RepID=A0A1Y6B4E6_9BACT|nr:thioredoxin domain-containing protein [Pseudobacteriovorax antillogorgiicola]TCS59312.1 thioredoxin 1 [Pseudobacteriovorax antillogorgiicola]SME89500.1 thioredoxin 1 [Pseudobacteriovorax antillogorgiicola]
MKFQKLDDNTFDQALTQSKKPALVYFWAPWSKPCESFTDTLEELQTNYDQRLEIFCMNVDENANIPASLGVSHIPMLARINHGQIQTSLMGRQAKVKIREFVAKVVDES